jgi:5-methylcytosine-specific restriction enzyme A
MATELTQKQFEEILLDKSITFPEDISLFQAIYSFEEHKAYASQVGRLLGHKGTKPHAPVNLQIGRLAKRIAKKHDIIFTVRENRKYKYWDLLFVGWEEGRFWVWQLKSALVKAMETTSLTGGIPYSDEFPFEYSGKLTEGIKKIVTVNAYERNPQVRKVNIAYWGTTCSVCNFSFAKVYGEIGKEFIHVHHLTPISETKESYEVDQIQDLRPVCPNCHAMLHRNVNLLSIEELELGLKPVKAYEIDEAFFQQFRG